MIHFFCTACLLLVKFVTFRAAYFFLKGLDVFALFLNPSNLCQSVEICGSSARGMALISSSENVMPLSKDSAHKIWHTDLIQI